MSLSDSVLSELQKSPLEIAVIGPVNVGKTSLIRTLTRSPNFGRVADTAGVTVEPMPVRLSLGAAATEPVVMKLFDTPGFQDVGNARHTLGFTPEVVEIVSYFQSAQLRHELRIIETLQHCHVAVYVIKLSDEPTDDHHEQLFLVQRMGCPVIVLIHRFSNEPREYRSEWEQLLRSCALQNKTMTIDARVFEPEQEENFYRLLRTQVGLDSPHDLLLQEFATIRRRAREEKLDRAAARIDEFLDGLNRHTRTQTNVDKQHVKEVQEAIRKQLEDDLETKRRGVDRDLLRIFDFNSACTITEEKAQKDSVANVKSKSWLGRRFGRHAATGAGVGLAMDAAGLLVGIPPIFTIAGLIGGVLGGGAYNIAYDSSANRVDGAFSPTVITSALERHLRLVQRLYTSGVAATTDGSLQDNPSAVNLGAFRLSDAAELHRQFETCLNDKAPLRDVIRELIRTITK